MSSPEQLLDETPKKPPGLLRSSAVVAAFTGLSRVLGLARDVTIAALVGAGANADCFFVAFKIPNFLRRLFAEGAFSQAFVPVLAEYKEKGSHAAVKELVDRTAGALGGVLILLSALAIVGAPVVTLIFAPGFHDNPLKLALTTEMIRLTFPYLFLISMTGFAGAILNSYNRFAVPAFTPVLLNVCLISAAFFASDWFEEPAMALAWGVLMAGIVQMAFQIPFLAQINLLPKPTLDFQHPGVRKIMLLMVPALFGVSISQINLLLDTVLASFLPTGSISWLYFSDRLVELPLGLFAIAIATVILPGLSRQQASEDEDGFARTLNWAVRMVLLMGLPAALALIVLADPILTTLFEYGELQERDTAMAVLSLCAYSLGLLAFMLIKVLAPGYFARQDMKTPVRIGIIAMVANMGLNIAFVLPLHHYYQIGHVGLALATAVSAWLNAGLLYRGLRKSGHMSADKESLAWIGRLVLASAAMVSVLLYLPQLTGMPDFSLLAWWHRVLLISALVGAGGLVYCGTLAATGLRIRDLHPL